MEKYIIIITNLYIFQLLHHPMLLYILTEYLQAGCGVILRGLDVRFHVRFECIQRIVPCRFNYCTKTFPLAQREAHELSEDCAVVAGREAVFAMVRFHVSKEANVIVELLG